MPKFVIGTEIKEAIKLAGLATSRDASKATLGMVLLTYADGLELQTTNLEQAIWVKLDAEPQHSETKFQALIPFKELAGWLANVAEPVEFELTASAVRLKTRNQKASFQSGNPEDFPLFPSAPPESETCRVEGEVFLNALKQGSYTASAKQVWSAARACAIYWRNTEEPFICSADDSRMALYGKFDSTKNPAIITRSTSEVLTKALAGQGQGKIELVQISDLLLVYGYEDKYDFAVAARTLAGKFPNVTPYVPVASATEVNVDRNSLADALKATMNFARNDSGRCLLEVKENELVISARAETAGGEVVVEAETLGVPMKIGVNARFLLESLAVMEDTRVVLGFNGARSPIKFVGNPNSVHVMAPVMRSEDDSEEPNA